MIFVGRLNLLKAFDALISERAVTARRRIGLSQPR